MYKQNITVARGGLGEVFVARVGPGTDLLEALREIVAEEGIEYGLIIGGAASLRQARLRNPRGWPKAFPISDEFRVFTDIDGPLEMTSLMGNVSRNQDGSANVHGHLTISMGNPEGLAFGGHLVKGTVIYTTGEICLAAVRGMKLLRELNDETHNFELKPRPE